MLSLRCGELRRGLDADPAETDTARTEMVRRYGEVVPFAGDTGLILVSNDQPFFYPATKWRNPSHARTPTALIAVHITKPPKTPPNIVCISPAPRISTKPLNKLSKS